jgi:F-type H+-transporting ATPase subunit b
MNYLFFAGMIDRTAGEFGVSGWQLLAQALSFGIVAFLLHRFAYRPVLKMLQERKERITESVANAEKIKEELARTEEIRKGIMLQANTQADKLIEEARVAAAKVLEAESQKAIATASQIIAKAHAANQAELARMKTELRHELGRLVVQAAQQVTGKILTAEDQQRLAEETNKELAA